MRPVMNKKLSQILNYRICVYLQDGRQYMGTFLAFDKFMNFVLGGCVERRSFRRPNDKPSKLQDNTLGLVLLRGENVASISTEGPPPPPSPSAIVEPMTLETATTSSVSAKTKPVPKRGRGRAIPPVRGRGPPHPVQNKFPPPHPGVIPAPGLLPPGYGPPAPPTFPPYGYTPVPGRGYPSTRGQPRHPGSMCGHPARGDTLQHNIMVTPPPITPGPPASHSGAMSIPVHGYPQTYEPYPHVESVPAQPTSGVMMPVPNVDYQVVYGPPPPVDNTATTLPYSESMPVPEKAIVHGQSDPSIENTQIVSHLGSMPILDYCYQSVPAPLPQVESIMTVPYVETVPGATYSYPVQHGIPGSDLYVQFQPQPMMPVMPQGTYYYIDQPLPL